MLQQPGAVDTHTGIAGQKQAETVSQVGNDCQGCRRWMAGIDALGLLLQDIADVLKKLGRGNCFQCAIEAHFRHGICGSKCCDTARAQAAVSCTGRVGRTVKNGQNPSRYDQRHIVPGRCGVLVFRLRKARDIHRRVFLAEGGWAEGGWRRQVCRRSCRLLVRDGMVSDERGFFVFREAEHDEDAKSGADQKDG
ncbi:hypothetical protein D3C87_1461810 [compost metagenome]